MFSKVQRNPICLALEGNLRRVEYLIFFDLFEKIIFIG